VAPFDKHVFSCTNERPGAHPRGGCGPARGEALHKAFKRALADLGLGRSIRANTAGCLDRCEHGPTVVVYPDGVWFGGVTPDDVPEIVARHLAAGEPVARLRLADACVNTATCPHRPRS
jgi:(2Fe-2S) ferredoxin